MKPYYRVIPRDLFNEANLLKCLGQLYLQLDSLGKTAQLLHEGEPFQIEQCPDDGSLSCVNCHIDGLHLWRPLNSREAYPLWASKGDMDVLVFHDDGTLTDEFEELLR